MEINKKSTENPRLKMERIDLIQKIKDADILTVDELRRLNHLERYDIKNYRKGGKYFYYKKKNKVRYDIYKFNEFVLENQTVDETKDFLKTQDLEIDNAKMRLFSMQFKSKNPNIIKKNEKLYNNVKILRKI